MNDLTPSDLEQLAALFTTNGWSEFRVRSGDVELFLSTNPETAALQARAPAAAPAKSKAEATPTAFGPMPMSLSRSAPRR